MMSNTIQDHRHENLAASVNTDLAWTIAAATRDFTIVSELLKKCYDNERRLKYEALITQLQYIDTFRQRVSHLIEVHQQLMDDGDLSCAESFFHLHVFQSMTIELDLLEATSAISRLLFDLNFDSLPFFANTLEIKSILNKTIARLLVVGGDKALLPIPPLSSYEVSVLNSVYTMDSERVVLSWFLESMPHGTWTELSHHYRRAIQGPDTNSELF